MADDLDANFIITVDRQDQGQATITLWKKLAGDWNWKKIAVAAHGGWDDALPWPIGNFDGTRLPGRFHHPGEPAGVTYPEWRLEEDFADRETINLHVRRPGVPISWGSFGCIVADGTFIDTVAKKVGNQDLDFQVRGFNPTLSLQLGATVTSVNEGEDFHLKVTLAGDGNGVSKDCYVLVKSEELSGQANATWDVDYKFDPKGLVDLFGTANAADEQNLHNTAITEHFLWVKIARGQTAGDITVHTTANDADTAPEKAQFTIVDYLFDSPKTLTGHRYYSDYLGAENGNGKVLLAASSDKSEIVTINSLEDLGKIDLNASGGIEGFSQTYRASKTQTYTWGFDAFTIPDTLHIFDNTGDYVNLTNVSGFNTNNFQLRSKSDGIVHVEISGSDSGTQWTLTISNAASFSRAVEDALDFAFYQSDKSVEEAPYDHSSWLI